MMLSISEFSEMCQLPPQTLRFYHAEGLLVPAQVDERTGYRSYTFDQVEQAMLIATLRRAGLGVQRVRQALDDVDTATTLLSNHREAMLRQRQQEDEAFQDALAFTTDWSQPHRYHVPGTAALSTLVPGGTYDDGAVATRILAAARELTRTAEDCGATVTGVAWKAYALDTEDQKKMIWTRQGPDWSVTVPVTADERVAAALPAGVTLTTFAARDEMSIVIPGRETLAKFATAVQRLVAHGAEHGCAVDLARPRHLLHHDSVEIAVAVLDDVESGESGEDGSQ